MPGFDPPDELEPNYLSGLDRLPLAQLRAKRESCVEMEMELSYVRRLAQARIDLIIAESERRHSGVASLSLDALVEQLPRILGDRGRQGGPGRLPSLLAPSSGAQSSLGARVEEVLPADRLRSLHDVPPEALSALLEELSALEHEVSARRRTLHDVIDRLQYELVRRYRSGEATVDSLLAGGPH